MYFEDIQVGVRTCTIDQFDVTEGDIVAFARQWDPMDIHVDPEFAAKTPFGSLIAPGLFGVGVAVRMSQDMGSDNRNVVAGLGWQDIQFRNPIRPGDRLHLETEVIETRRSQSRPGTGISRTRLDVVQADGTVATSLVVSALVRCRRNREDHP